MLVADAVETVLNLPFEPHPFVYGGHAQTLAGVYLPGPKFPYRARQHRVLLEDGDCLVLHDDRPMHWRPNDPSALLVHGLSGSYQSAYMQRLAGRLSLRGIRSFRLDLRGAGAGAFLARSSYHSGRTDDLAAALERIAEHCPQSPTALIGFSVGGNMAIKLLGELEDRSCGNLVAGIAVSPPIELATCCQRLQEDGNRMYDRHFVSALWRQLGARNRRLPGISSGRLSHRPRTMWEFDDQYTAEVGGFGNAETYYRECSGAQFVPGIRRPTFILASADDPFIPAPMFDRIDYPSAVTLHVASGGGHLGFVGRRRSDPDRRWMDWRIIERLELAFGLPGRDSIRA